MATESADPEAALRIRLEGRLEVLESASQSLEELEKLLRKRKWPDANALRAHLHTWEAVQPRVAASIDAAHRANGSAPVERLTRARDSLERALQERFKASTIGRAHPSERIGLWRQLVDAMKAPARSEQWIAEVSITFHGWRWWLGLLALSLAILPLSFSHALGVSLGVVLAAPIAFYVMSTKLRYRLSRDALVRETWGEPTLRLPLTSFERAEAAPGTTLRGLVDIELGHEDGSAEVCALINRLARDREFERSLRP